MSDYEEDARRIVITTGAQRSGNMTIDVFRNYFKQLSCKHEWSYVGKIAQCRGFYSKVYHCRKCGKFKEEPVVE